MTGTRGSLRLVVVLLGVLGGTSPGRAQPPPDPQHFAAAQALFDEARQLMDASRFKEACPRLEEVVRLEPRGLGAKLRLAQCYEGAGRLASAFASYTIVSQEAQQAGQDERAVFAAERAKQLKPRLSRLTIQVPEGLRAQAGFELLRDGEVMGEPQWGAAIPVDGGAHTILARARGKRAFERVVEVATEGARVVVEIPVLEGATEPPASAAPSAPVTPPPAPPTAPPAGLARSPRWPYAVGGAGALMLAGGALFFLQERAIASRQLDTCGGDLKQCGRASPGYDPAPDNERKATYYTLFVGFSAAGTLLVGGAALGLLWPRQRAVSLAPWPGGASLQGRF